MEPVHVLQRSDQKRVEEVKRVRNALVAGESVPQKLRRTSSWNAPGNWRLMKTPNCRKSLYPSIWREAMTAY
jgi:hypothetical protein